jgi:hypothetical protein
MPADRLQIVSGVLTREQLDAEVAHLAGFLSERCVDTVLVEHWFGKAEVAAADLPRAFREGFEVSGPAGRRVHLGRFDSTLPLRRIYLGDADFVIRLPGQETSFEFCHEDELHVTSPDADVRSVFRARWRSRGYAIRDPHDA